MLECDKMFADLQSDLAGTRLIELDPTVSNLALGVLRRYALRAGDAIQLASALHLWQRMGSSVEFICFDRRLNEAALAEGLTTLIS